ncbi:MAG: FG-GAP repeat protein [Flavobacteriales bacterium]|nr:FG-GAP repeat protein [Flavobacteriales bacterium]
MSVPSIPVLAVMAGLAAIARPTLLCGQGATTDFAEAIEASEMDMHPEPHGPGFTTLCRMQGLQHRITGSSFEVRGPIPETSWHERIELVSFGRAGSARSSVAIGEPRRSAARLDYPTSFGTLEYVNGNGGLRQNFHVARKPSGEGLLQVDLHCTGGLEPFVRSATEVVFRDKSGLDRFRYRDLRCWDAKGRELTAQMDVQPGVGGSRLTISVDDSSAQYPIVIDPVSTSPNTLLVGTQATMEFGIAVATAGDLNGDGYSDVVVGAWYADLGQTNEGAAYVYYGSVTGIPTTPSLILQCDQQGAQMGCAVSTAGDVNGDGYADLLVGARAWESDPVNEATEGGVFVYYGSATGINSIPDLTLQTNHAGDSFGSNVAALGDIDDDGYSDIIVGAYLSEYPSYQEGTCFIYMGSAVGLNTVPRHHLERNIGAAHFGRSVAGAGDVNGDGYDDVIVGSPDWTNVINDDGAAFVYYGSANALGAATNPAPSLILYGSAFNNGSFGWSVGCAGDVNGDGYSDVAVGAYYDNIGGPAQEGTAWVFLGSAGGLSTTAATVLQGNQSNAWMGRWVGTAGDMNGDGYGDLIVGVPRYSVPETQEGVVYLYFGGPSGISTIPSLSFQLNDAGANLGECVSTAGDVNGDGYSDVILGARIYGLGGAAAIFHGGPYNMKTSPDADISGGAAGARMGEAVSNAGDVNGDGFADVIVGAPYASNGQANEGLAYLYLGSPSGPSNTPDATFEANVASGHFGASVCTAGDVNGDGYADIIIGAPDLGVGGRAYIHHGGPGGPNTVASRVLFGIAGARFGTSVSAAGDINSDGYADVIVGAPGINTAYVLLGSATGIPALPHATLNEGSAGDLFGSAVATAGDVNGDGYSDVLVGAPDHTNGQTGEGAAYLYYGSETGLVLPYASKLERNLASARFGISLAGAGDVNGDGFFDVIVGADHWASGQSGEGGAFVFHGSAGGLGANPSQTIQINQVDAHLGASVAEAGDINGDGYADVVVGVPNGWNNVAQVDEGYAMIYRGSPSGIVLAPDRIETNTAGDLLGTAVSGGGDVDGDGFSDVLSGKPGTSPTFASEGGWMWNRGGKGTGQVQLSRQYQADLINPLATNCMDFTDPDYFGIGHLSRSPVQRCDGRLVYEVVFEGQPFTGAPITNSLLSTGMSAAWTDLTPGGVEIKELIYKIPGYIRYKWRCRVEYEMAKAIDGQRYGRWFYGYASGLGDIGVLPIELIAFDAHVDGPANKVVWSTATESGTDSFHVERGTDLGTFSEIGVVPAAGESQSTIAYAFMDDAPPQGLSFYRLAIRSTDGTIEHGPVVAVQRTGRNEGPLIWYDPESGSVRISRIPPEVDMLLVTDASGRIIARSKAQGHESLSIALEGFSLGRYDVLFTGPSGERLGARSIMRY